MPAIADQSALHDGNCQHQGISISCSKGSKEEFLCPLVQLSARQEWPVVCLLMATGLSTNLSLGFKMFFSPEFNQGVEKMVNMKHWCSVSAMRAQLAICKCALCYCYIMIWQSKGFLHGAHVKSPPCFLYLVLLWEHQFWCTMTHCQWVNLCAFLITK